MAKVLIIPDTHCPAMRRGFVDFLKRTADKYQPDKVVHIGDAVDWHSISYHERLPTLSSAEQEYKLAKKQIQKLAEAFPEAYWMIGNHDSLTERQATTAGLPPSVLRDYNDLWEVPWKVMPRFSELQIDGVIYTHGEGSSGMYAHGLRAKARRRSLVMGHLHSNAGTIWDATPEDRIFGLAVGCGVDNDKMQFLYGRASARKPMLGCGFVDNGKDAFFLPWQLPSR